MSRKVLMHVGTPKSGTSYLQDRLALNRDGLRTQGLDYVETRTGDHFEAALDLLGERWAGAEKAAKGQWDALVTEAGRSRADILISHEILAAVPLDAVRRARAAFAGDEVHVVVTARDLGRQVPAEWQERVKHRGRREYEKFLEAMVRNHARTDWRMWFWRVQDLPAVLTTWGAGLSPDQIHLVTVPGPGGPRGALWDRFSSVLGLDPGAPYAETQTTNASLGGAEVTLLRRLNIALAERELPRTTYVTWVRELIVREVLAERKEMELASVPPQHRAFVEDVTDGWIDWIRQSGVHVVGDVEDLLPRWPDDVAGWTSPDDADPAVVADAAIEALAHVLDQIAQGKAETNPVSKIARRLRS